MAEYYRVNLKKSLEEAIEQLFEDNERVSKMYDNNKVTFIETAVRKQLEFYSFSKSSNSKS